VFNASPTRWIVDEQLCLPALAIMRITASEHDGRGSVARRAAYERLQPWRSAHPHRRLLSYSDK
jgi:hypothetical protein